MTVMLYKYPGKHRIHGNDFDYVSVSELDVGAHIESGWSRTTTEALENHRDLREEDSIPNPSMNALAAFAVENSLNTKKDLQEKAKELDIDFDGRASEKTLLKKIYEKVITPA